MSHQASVMYWLSETVFRFDGDSNANVSAEQGMTRSSQLPTRPSGIIISPIFCTLGTIRERCKVRTDFHGFSLNIRHPEQPAQGFINWELDKLLKVCFTTNCLQQQQMMEESWGLILHRIEIFILNVKPRLRLSLFWTVVGSFHPHHNFNYNF